MVRKKRRGRSEITRIGKVTLFMHHNTWWIRYRENGECQRRRVGPDYGEAEATAAQVNAQVTSGQRSMFSFTPVEFDVLADRWLGHHEHVLGSSLATQNRYRTAVEHGRRYVHQLGHVVHVHKFDAENFMRYLRGIQVAANGRPRAQKCPLRAKGILFIMRSHRSMFNFGARHRAFPPYAENPFAVLPMRRAAADDAKPVHVFSAAEECAFLSAGGPWQFAIFYTFARTGLRPAELTHLLVEDIDLENGLLQVRSKPDLGWRIKTRIARDIPLPKECMQVLQKVLAGRKAGVLFLQHRYQTQAPPLAGLGHSGLVAELNKRVATKARMLGRATTPREEARLARDVWGDAGAMKPERIRRAFGKLTAGIGLSTVTAPKSWRHTFATAMLEAGVDPKVRWITLGHSSHEDGKGPLGMTGVYSHPQREVHRQQLQRVVDLRPKTSDLARSFLEEGLIRSEVLPGMGTKP